MGSTASSPNSNNANSGKAHRFNAFPSTHCAPAKESNPSDCLLPEIGEHLPDGLLVSAELVRQLPPEFGRLPQRRVHAPTEARRRALVPHHRPGAAREHSCHLLHHALVELLCPGAVVRQELRLLCHQVAFLIISSDSSARSPEFTGVLLWLWVLNLAKVIHLLVVAELTKNSFAVSLNTYLLADYMKQLYGQDDRGEDAQEQDDVQAFPYLVMGGDNLRIEPTPQGYRIGRTSAPSLSVDVGHVVTMYRIWRLSSTGDPVLASYP
ncbi:hypothetical protein GUJ93_ZPchr0002g26004 [Zizania palustris]|uniref:Uncharacterized protein n=1 Tax=Zizania palustris TaxID=103762 RepID=A0A8J5SB35_ZIZPA|nr:hypothetical protein GUJ93_ZPchr0002g26004 [Zizania palustris]